jgi:hypothetical protein
LLIFGIALERLFFVDWNMGLVHCISTPYDPNAPTTGRWLANPLQSSMMSGNSI